MAVDQHSYKKLSLKKFPKLVERETNEANFWKKYQFPITVKDSAPITSIHFSPSPSHDYAVTSGSKVQLYSATNNQVKKTISRFHQTAYSGCYRNDGKLIAAGSEEGVVKVFDISSRSILRQCAGHSKPSKTVRFSSDGLKLFSGSDDTTVKYWDIATQECVTTLRGHEDYIRRVVPSPNSCDLVVTGSYDHTVQLWDVRTPSSSVVECNHGAPVEDLLIFPSGGTCVSCGSHWICVWDLLAGGKLLLSFTNHQKTITSLCLDGSSERLLSSGLDRQVKVYSVEDYRILYNMSYPAPVLSMAMSPSDSHLVVGMASKLLSIKYRVPKIDSTPSSSSSLRGGSYRYFMRGKSYKPEPGEFIATLPKIERLTPYENFLKKFKYKKALESVLEVPGRGRALIVFSVIQELARRDGLHIALSGLGEDQLYPLLKYLTRNLTQPRYTSLLLDVCNLITDIYGCMLSQSKTTRTLFRVLKVKIDREVQFQKHAFHLLGSINTLLTASIATHKLTSTDI